MSDAPTSPRFSAATSTRLLDHAQLEALCADYDGFLLDLWGVVMDGAEAFPAPLPGSPGGTPKAARSGSSATRPAAWWK